MVKSMFAAVAGLKTHQSKLDVIGNNIANVNTWGYKPMAASFSDSMYQTITQPSGAAGNGGLGGINASQVGYGSVMSSIRTNFSQGSPYYTGNAQDTMINGPGYFMVGPKWQTGTDDDAKPPYDLYLTRVGEFEWKDGYLTDAQGNYVYGSPVSATGGVPHGMTENPPGSGKYEYNPAPTDLKPIKQPTGAPAVPAGETITGGYTIDATGKITAKTDKGTEVLVGYLPVINVANPGGMTKKEGYYYEMQGDATGASGKATIMGAGTGGGSLLTSYLEMANVDLAQQFAEMITTQRGFQANSKMISVTDEMLQELVNLKR